MKLKLMTAAVLLLASTSLSQAAWSSQQVIDQYRAEGYTRVEVKMSATQAKVEAIKGTQKVEVIYDLATGAILKKETETVRGGENTTPGTFVRTVSGSRSFDDSNDSDDDGPHHRRHSGDDDDDDDHHGSRRGSHHHSGRDGGDDD
jgi:hypothetical protein